MFTKSKLGFSLTVANDIRSDGIERHKSFPTRIFFTNPESQNVEGKMELSLTKASQTEIELHIFDVFKIDIRV